MRGNRPKWRLGIVTAVLAAITGVLMVGGYALFRFQAETIKEARFNEISAISELKSAQITYWIEERLDDVGMNAATGLRNLALEWLRTPQDLANREALWQRLDLIRQYHEYVDAIVVVPGENTAFSLQSESLLLDDETLQLVARVVATDSTLLGNFVFSEDTKAIHLDAATPIREDGAVQAVLLLRSNPAIDLYPMIRRWPTPSKTAESFLVEVDGNEALFLSELRHVTDATLQFRISLDRDDLPTAMAARGIFGQLEGRDYHGVAVLADVRPIPDTPWYLVSKVDQAEVLAEARYRGRVIGAIVGLTLLLVLVILFSLIQNREARTRFSRMLLQIDRERLEAEAAIRCTFEQAALGIANVSPDGRFIRVNDKLSRFLGYTADELCALTFQDITFPDDLAEDLSLVNQLLKDEIQTYSMEKRYRHREGHMLWANLTVSLVRSQDRKPKYFISIVEDISARKAAEQALAASEQRQHELFEISPMPMWVYDLDTSKMIAVNAAALKQYGYCEDAFLGLSIADIVLGTVDEKAGSPATIERHRYQDGSEHVVEVLTQKLQQYDGHPAALTVVNDIAARLEAERNLLATEARLAELTAQSPVVLYALGINGENVAPRYVSENVMRMSGYTVEEALASDWWESRLHPDDHDRLMKAQASLLETESTCDDYRFRHKAGHYIWVRDERRLIYDSTGQVAELVGTWSDITATQEAIEALRIAMERLEAAEALANLGSWSFDLATGTGTWSKEMFRLFHLPFQDTAPEVAIYLQRIHPEDRYSIQDAMEKMAAGQEPVVRIYRSNPEFGPVRYLRPAWQRIEDEHGTAIRYDGTVLDITDRVEHEKALHEERQRLAYVLEGADVGAWEWNIQEGSLHCNERWAEILGFSLADLGSLQFVTWLSVIHPDDFPRMNKAADAHFDGLTPFYECDIRVQHASGRWLWLHDRGKLITRTEEGRPSVMYGTTTDITSRKQAEESLRESETRYRLLFENTLSGVIIVDAVTDASGAIEDFIFVSANAASQIHTGMSSEEIIGQRMLTLSPELRHEPAFAKLKEVAETGAPQEYDFYDPAFERYFHVAAHAVSYHRVACVFQDITVRKKNEAEIRKLSMAVEQSPASVVITDTQGLIEYVNPKFTELTGYTLDEVRGNTPSVLKSGETSAEEYKALWKTITSGKEWQGEFRNRRKDGSYYYERATISPIRDADGKISHFLANKEDITAHKHLEQQFLQSQRLEAVGKLAGGVAHDFNNMLAVILGNAELALQQVEDSDPLYNDLSGIVTAAQRSANLTRQLLAFARLQTSSPRVLDLNETLEELMKMMKRLIGEDIELVWEPTSDLWKVQVDPAQIDQILANLLVNARDAIGGTGRIVVSTRNEILRPDKAREMLEATPGEYAVISVRDTGVGISKEIQERIFEPFFTTKAAGTGTGLGLSTIYGIAKQNKGFVTLSSEPGQGATFEVYFPRDLSASASSATTPDAPPKGGAETVLIVEDEPGILELGVRILDRYGYTVLKAGTPDQARAVAEKHEGAIDLLLTDVVMPGMNGHDLAQILAERHPEMKVLYMSGYTADVISAQGILHEGIHFLHKPFTMKVLLQKVREVLDA